MSNSLTREDLIDGLRELVAGLRRQGNPVGIRLVGGAALALRYFDRRTTHDVDILRVNPGSDSDVILEVERIADLKGWSRDWVNFGVTKADALPTLGRQVEWEVIHNRDGIVIEVASKEAMLAMKLRAARPGRDTDDIRKLLPLCHISSIEAAEELYELFYPGDVLSDRAVAQISNILLEKPASPSIGVPPITL